MLNEQQTARTPMKILSLSLILILGVAGVIGIWTLLPGLLHRPANNPSTADIVAFSSNTEYQDYLTRSAALYPTAVFSRDSAEIGLGALPSAAPTKDIASETPNVIGTNVQTPGLDEPDIVKTNGQGLYISQEASFAYKALSDVSIEPVAGPLEAGTGSAAITTPSTVVEPSAPDDKPTDSRTIYPPIQKTETAVVDVRTLTALKKIGVVPEQGDLLLSGSTLIILQSNAVSAYSIADPVDPKKIWSWTVADGASIVTARSVGTSILLVTQRSAERGTPCPMPLVKSSEALDLSCARLYHPVDPSPTSTIFAVMKINPTNGLITERAGFTGSSIASTVYVSTTAAYVTIPEVTDPVRYQFEFYRSLGSKLPNTLQARLQTLEGYNLSADSKLNEFQRAIELYVKDLSVSAQKTFTDLVAAEQKKYTTLHLRDQNRTTIIKINLSDVTVAATGVVPGQILNQYSLDESNGHLRAATTVGGNWWFASDDSANDVYVLDQNLRTVGSVLDLGKGERIYSVRFSGERGYVVTFKQTDPFFVLDLSQPTSPKMTGELALPGYSSYLHPLSATLVLGIGQESFNSKATLFDVTDPAAPKVLTTVTLPAGWSEVQNNPHAFLQDTRHSLVFVPAGSAGMVLSYDRNELTVKLSIPTLNARRAVVIDDRMIIIGDTTLAVVNETNMTIEQRLTFRE